MSRKILSRTAGLAAWAALAASAAAQDGAAGGLAPSPPFTPPQITPSLPDFVTGRPVATCMKLAETDPLLRPPFAGLPVDDPKGLAAAIKAMELDVPNRIAAARYLGTLDCVKFPEAREKLIGLAIEDPFEPVRYEAVMAIRIMLARGIDNPRRASRVAGCGCQRCKDREEEIEDIVEETEKHACKAALHACLPKNPCELVHQTLPKVIHAPCVLAEKIKLRCQTGVPAEALRYDYCRGCCNVDTLNALSKIANDRDEQGCPLEPSPRVRAAAASALLLCDCVPRAVVPMDPTMPPPPPEVEGEGDPNIGEGNPGIGEGDPGMAPEGDAPEGPPSDEGVLPQGEQERFQDAPPEASNEPGLLKTGSAGKGGVIRPASGFDPASAADPNAPPLAALRDYCVVALHDHKFVTADPNQTSVYKGRTFFFASAKAKARFDVDPDRFAPAFCGMDPVSYVEREELQEGRLLREHDGRFYLFADEASWKTFRADPEKYSSR